MQTVRRIFLACVAFILVTAMITARAFAHPMGNFSINHYARLEPERDAVRIRYLVDMAEIPTFQEIQRTGLVPKEGDPSVKRSLEAEAATLTAGLSLSVAGTPLHLSIVSSGAIFPPGAGGLPTMKIGVVYRAPMPPNASANHQSALEYRDDNFAGRAGWKEIIAKPGAGVVLASSTVPTRDRSAELSNYPTDLLNSPPQVLEARLSLAPTMGLAREAAPTGSAFDLRANAQGTPRSAFTELITSREHSIGFLLIAAAIAAFLGGLHAMEPGHGKTLVAAYLIGSRSSLRHVVMLGSIVTASHTASVYILGIVTLYASHWIVPERLYPWLGFASGLLVAMLGLALIARRLRSTPYSHEHHSRGHDHHHEHGHHHSHGHLHRHGHEHSTLSNRELFALGITGGIVPCPAALVVLLSAIAIGRVAFGLYLIVAFSIGLAAVLIFFGLAMVYARRFMSRRRTDGAIVTRWLPIASSVVITMVGIAMAMSSAGIIRAGM